jgi:hypothetical protein
MLHLFYRIITLRYSASWPLSRKGATRWNVAVRSADTADCSLRRRQEDATPPSSSRAARCEGELSAGSFRQVLHRTAPHRTALCISTFSYRKFRTALPSHSSQFLLQTVLIVPFLQPLYHRYMFQGTPPPPTPALRSDIYSYICGLHKFVREQGVQEGVCTDSKK